MTSKPCRVFLFLMVVELLSVRRRFFLLNLRNIMLKYFYVLKSSFACRICFLGNITAIWYK